MVFRLLRDAIYRNRELRGVKFKKHPKRLVWRTPGPEKTASSDRRAISYAFPTVSTRKIRYLGRREVYPHSLHVHITPIYRIEEP